VLAVEHLGLQRRPEALGPYRPEQKQWTDGAVAGEPDAMVAL